MSDERREGRTGKQEAGLCADCAQARVVESARGSRFVLCARSATDAAFAKYPRLPVIACAGYEGERREETP